LPFFDRSQLLFRSEFLKKCCLNSRIRQVGKLNEKFDGFGILQEFFRNSSGILLEFSRNSSKIQVGIPVRKSASFPNMFCFTYKYSFSTCLVNVSCRWCIALWFEKISWPASNNCPFSWCCCKKMKIKFTKWDQNWKHSLKLMHCGPYGNTGCGVFKRGLQN
jgi:hypothetical protein